MAGSTPQLEVMVIEDHPLFCEALSMTLREGFSVRDINAQPTLERALGALRDGADPDLIVLDLNLPDVSGMDGLIRIKASCPETPVIVVSSLNDNRIVDSVLKHGGSGFVSKDSSREVILSAFRTVHDGGRFIPEAYVPSGDDASGQGENQEYARRLGDLTPQQGRILQSICAGKLNKQIAFDLSISEATVKAHVTAILRKLGVHSRTQAVLVAQKVHFASILKDG